MQVGMPFIKEFKKLKGLEQIIRATWGTREKPREGGEGLQENG